VVGENVRPTASRCLRSRAISAAAGVGAEADLVEAACGFFRSGPFGVVHAAAGIDHQLAAQVGLFLIALHEELVRAGEELPIDVAGAFAGVVRAVLGEFHAEAVEGAFVQAGQEAFHHLAGMELQLAKGLNMVLVYRHRRGKGRVCG
jgi:hypothetical protein